MFEGTDRNKNISAPHGRALTLVYRGRGSGFKELLEKFKSGISHHKNLQILFTLLQKVYFLYHSALKNCRATISYSSIATNKVSGLEYNA